MEFYFQLFSLMFGVLAVISQVTPPEKYLRKTVP